MTDPTSERECQYNGSFCGDTGCPTHGDGEQLTPERALPTGWNRDPHHSTRILGPGGLSLDNVPGGYAGAVLGVEFMIPSEVIAWLIRDRWSDVTPSQPLDMMLNELGRQKLIANRGAFPCAECGRLSQNEWEHLTHHSVEYLKKFEKGRP